MKQEGLFAFPDFGVPHGDAEAAARRLGVGVDLGSMFENYETIKFAVRIADAERLDELGNVNWGAMHGRPDIPSEIWNRRVCFSFGCRKSYRWFPASLTLGSLALLLFMRAETLSKDARGIVLSAFASVRRKKGSDDTAGVEGVTKVSGLSLDDDGVLGKHRVVPGALVLRYSTSSDGKREDLIGCDAYQKFAAKHDLPSVPSDASMSKYLNQKCDHGDAFREVSLEPHANFIGKPNVIMDDGIAHYKAFFNAQERDRYIVCFNEPLEGELMCKLLRANAFKRFSMLVEQKALGVQGTDPSCFEPTRIAYLPSGNRPNYSAAVIGQPGLLDPRPLAEQAIAETPKRKVTTYSIGSFASVPEHLAANLRGVQLASLISDLYPELVIRENGLRPLELKCCPFAQEHSSKRGKADGSLYCYDPDRTPYPVMRCRHTTCGDRRTEDFVEAMIHAGDLDRASVFENADYRQDYQTEQSDTRPPELQNGWRNHVIKK